MNHSTDTVLKYTHMTREAAKELDPAEARMLVAYYYQTQRDRVAMNNRIKAIEKADGNPAVFIHIHKQLEVVEVQTRNLLGIYSRAQHMGQWASGIIGIGPVISAGLMSYIDITKAPTVGHIWSYAGLVPGQRRRKGQKASFSPQFKSLTWKIGESFVKQSGNSKDIYGKLILERKAYEQELNEAGKYEAQAKVRLEECDFGDNSVHDWYKKGMLPPVHLHERAKRWAVKLFLAHWHEEAYITHYGIQPPLPYPIVHLGHAHVIAKPEIETTV